MLPPAVGLAANAPWGIVTGVLMAQAALTLLEDDVELGGGIYTASLLG